MQILCPQANKNQTNSHLDESKSSVCTGNYREESYRLKTFEYWSNKHINPGKLAKLGFFYTHSGDEIQCAFCGIQLSNWCSDIDPDLQHQLYSYECDFLQNRDCGNISLRII